MPQVTAPGKLWALMLVIGGCFAYLVANAGDPTPAWATITLATGYLVGNGVGALRGQASAAVFTPAREPELLEVEGAIAIRRLSPDEVKRRDELLGRLAALDEDERRELQALVRAGA
jgi:hypothetical protein